MSDKRAERPSPLDRLDPEARAQAEAFAQTLGAKITHVGSRNVPDPAIPRDAASSWREWERRRNNRIFVRDRRSPAQAKADEAQEEQRRNDWLTYWRKIARNWAKWCRWHNEDPLAADQYRREHAGVDGDDACWLEQFSDFRVPRSKNIGLQKRAPGTNVKDIARKAVDGTAAKNGPWEHAMKQRFSR
jgi:hypothetical protein